MEALDTDRIGDLGEIDLRVELPSAVSAPCAAREAVKVLRADVGDDVLRDLELLVSEVVTNSVRHADTPEGAPIGLRLRLAPERVRVEVCDDGTAFGPRPGPSPDRPGGWGLYIVDRLADRWGVETHGRTAVWFEIDRQAA